MALEPAAEAVQAGEEHPLVDVGLVQLVAHLPLQSRRNDNLAGDAGVGAEPVVQHQARVGHDRTEGVLVDDAVVNGGGLEEDQHLLAVQGIQFVQGVDHVRQQFNGQHVGPLLLHPFPQAPGEAFVGLDVVHRPDSAVAVEFLQVARGEVHGHEGGIGPVHHPCGQAVMLGNGEPVPEGVRLHHVAVGVLLEIAQHVPLQLGKGTSHAHQGRLQAVAAVGKTAEGHP